tara:strand:- start:13 stop:549 length:537 start_codon:yes stop_codon:yes gene_type:complete
MNLSDYDIQRLKQLIVIYTKDNSLLARDESAHSSFLSNSEYTSDEHKIAISAIKENVLQDISNELVKKYNEEEKFLIEKENSFHGLDLLTEAYDIFSFNEKKELLPLFYSFDLRLNKSIFFENESIRDHFFKLFLILLNNDKLSLDKVKKQYLYDENFRFNIMYPMYEKIMSLSIMIS